MTLLQVGLVRQMERSQKEFQDWRREREREVMQLRRQVSTCQLWLQHCSNSTSQKLALTGAQAAQEGKREHWWRTVHPITSACEKWCLHEVRHTLMHLRHMICWQQEHNFEFLVQGRKTAAQVQRLEALHAKQQAVLRRKTEEAEAARKRLHVRPRR